jgi:hypothetical protein
MILILILMLIIIILIVYVRAETFQDLNKKELESVEKSVNNFKKELNLNDEDVDLDSPLLKEYLNTLIGTTTNLDQMTDHELPFIENNNYKKYNHKLKLLLNSKKIRQLYIINILKNKIKYLSGSLKQIKQLKDGQNNIKNSIEQENKRIEDNQNKTKEAHFLKLNNTS